MLRMLPRPVVSDRDSVQPKGSARGDDLLRASTGILRGLVGSANKKRVFGSNL